MMGKAISGLLIGLTLAASSGAAVGGEVRPCEGLEGLDLAECQHAQAAKDRTAKERQKMPVSVTAPDTPLAPPNPTVDATELHGCTVPKWTNEPKLWAEFIRCKEKAIREETAREAAEARERAAAAERRADRDLSERRIRALEEANRPKTCTSWRDRWGNWNQRCS